MDGRAQVCALMGSMMENIGEKISTKAHIRMQISNHKKAKLLGIAHDIKVKMLNIDCLVDFYVIKAMKDAFPVILGRPLIIALGAKQD